MAGGKETPRQAMINLMYIVFLALLAMQVSGDIMTKFLAINESLVQSVKNTTENSTNKISAITKSVEERGNSPEDVRVLKAANELREKTTEVVKYLNDTKHELIEAGGGYAEDGETPKTLSADDKVALFMKGPADKKNGRGYEVKTKLDDYVKWINDLADKVKFETDFPMLALSGKEDPFAKRDKDQAKKDFVELNFEHTPLAAGLAVLSNKQANVLGYESELLSYLASQVGAQNIEFDQIIPMVRAESNTVAAGTKYKAEMFLTATSSMAKPKFKFGGREVPAEDGKGIVEFKVSGGNYDAEGKIKKTWTGEIILPVPGKGDSTFQVVGEYVVTKPVIQVQSASVSALYKNCFNEIIVNVPALGAAYNPRFVAQGNHFTIKQIDKGKIGIIPSAKRKVVFDVVNDGSNIGSVDFQVKDIPKPTVVAKYKGRPIDMKKGVSECPAYLDLDAQADASFAEFLPKEARYNVAKGTVSLAAGTRNIDKANIINGKANLTSLRGRASKGMRLIVELDLVQRANSQNQIEKVEPTTKIFTIPIN